MATETAIIRYPEVTVQLTGQDGNAFFIIGRVTAALRKAGVTEEEREEFTEDAMSGDYDHVLQTVLAWVTVK